MENIIWCRANFVVLICAAICAHSKGHRAARLGPPSGLHQALGAVGSRGDIIVETGFRRQCPIQGL